MNAKHEDFLKMVNAMPTTTTAQRARKEKALQHLEAAIRPVNTDCGGYGKVAEILSKSNGSNARNYAKQGKADCFVWIEDENGKRHRYTAECKTNGGRIEALMTPKAPKFVVYSMDLCNSTTKGKRRVVEPRVIRTELFLAKLAEFKAIKETKGKHNELAIQPSKKAFYEWLLDYPVTYDPNETYYESDFDVE
jgi:hypothetical protein